MQRHYGYALILAAAAAWGLLGPVSRIFLNKGFDPLELAFWRTAAGGLLFCLHAGLKKELRLERTADLPWFVCFGTIAAAALFGIYQHAVREGGAALAAVLLYTAPAWVVLFSRVLFGEPLTIVKAGAVSASLAGTACIAFSGSEAPVGNLSAGIIFGLASGFLYACHFPFTKVFLRRYSPTALYGISFCCGAPALLPFVRFTDKTPADWAVIILLVLFSTYGAYAVYCEGIKRIGITQAAVTASFEPVLATAVACLWWGETFTPAGWAGTALILAAVFACVLEKPGPAPSSLNIAKADMK